LIIPLKLNYFYKRLFGTPKPLEYIPKSYAHSRAHSAGLAAGVVEIYGGQAVVEAQGEAAGGRVVHVLLVQQARRKHGGEVEGGVAHAEVGEGGGGEAQGAVVARGGYVLGAGEEVEQVEGTVDAQGGVA